MRNIVSIMKLLLGILIPISILIGLNKVDSLKLLKRKLYSLFFVDIFDNKEGCKIEGILKFLSLISKVSLTFYIFSITMYATNIVLYIDRFEISKLISLVASIILFPMMYRIVMGFQLKIHNIKREK